MDKLFTDLRFTSEDIESLGLQIAKAEFKFEEAQQGNKLIKKWLRSNCSTTWGHSTTPRSYHAPAGGDDYIAWFRTNYLHAYFYIFTDEADLLSLKLAFDEVQIRCLWPSRMPFNMFLIEEE